MSTERVTFSDLYVDMKFCVAYGQSIAVPNFPTATSLQEGRVKDIHGDWFYVSFSCDEPVIWVPLHSSDVEKLRRLY
jgi:hypothetical protein